MTDLWLAGMFYYDEHAFGGMFHYKAEVLRTG